MFSLCYEKQYLPAKYEKNAVTKNTSAGPRMGFNKHADFIF